MTRFWNKSLRPPYRVMAAVLAGAFVSATLSPAWARVWIAFGWQRLIRSMFPPTDVVQIHLYYVIPEMTLTSGAGFLIGLIAYKRWFQYSLHFSLGFFAFPVVTMTHLYFLHCSTQTLASALRNMLPWPPATIIPCLAAAWFVSRTKRRRIARLAAGLCEHCGYDLTGNVSGVCPECGKSIHPARTRQQYS
jgi:hypothetical protein